MLSHEDDGQGLTARKDTGGCRFVGENAQQDGTGLPKAWVKDQERYTWNRFVYTGGEWTKAEGSTRSTYSSTQVSRPTARVYASDHAML